MTVKTRDTFEAELALRLPMGISITTYDAEHVTFTSKSSNSTYQALDRLRKMLYAAVEEVDRAQAQQNLKASILPKDES